ncbi:hypothetical protein [Amycolatopsis sp. H20-H5]|uniref:hypothetical protein n=1 Tax=Amycolatopsis sp. H20-H5 TaxID=3046309 RepID=UPI002DBCCB98|nr:hypothetical protein [Amycolatopsis sp. H20-H5]MEC3974879.1 hypothetical protein [Amycolatopsis sp. H20-H5]
MITDIASCQSDRPCGAMEVLSEQRQATYVFVGEGITFTDERQEILERTASFFIANNVRLVTVAPAGTFAVVSEDESDFMPVTRNGLVQFAIEKKLPVQRAKIAWNALMHKSDDPEYDRKRGIPAVRLGRADTL